MMPAVSAQDAGADSQWIERLHLPEGAIGIGAPMVLRSVKEDSTLTPFAIIVSVPNDDTGPIVIRQMVILRVELTIW